VNAPVQLICGRSDPLEARDKLVESGEEVQLNLYEDEGYVFLNIHNVIHSDLMRVEFLEQVLKTH
jgi:hypothetical protein